MDWPSALLTFGEADHGRRFKAGQGGELPESGSGFIAEACDRFEAAWCEGRQPRIEDFLPPVTPDQDPATLHRLLVQLVGIDLEHRWQMATETIDWKPAGGEPTAAAPETVPFPLRPRLADYVARYPVLGPVEQLPLDLIIDEYYARRRYGDRPTHAEYLETFGRVVPGPGGAASGHRRWEWLPRSIFPPILLPTMGRRQAPR